MKTAQHIAHEAVERYAGREIFKDLNPHDVAQNILDIATFASLETATAIKNADTKQVVFVRFMDGAEDVQAWLNGLTINHTIDSVSMEGIKYVVLATRNAPEEGDERVE